MITEEKAQKAKEIVSGWDEETQKSFKDQYASLEDDDKREAVLTKVLDKYSKEEEAPEPEKKLEANLSAGDKVIDFVTGGMVSKLDVANQELQKKNEEEIVSGKRGAVEKKVYEEMKPLRETLDMEARIASSIAVGIGADKALQAIPFLKNQKIVQGLVASLETKAMNAGIKMSNVQRTAQRLAVEGAVSAQPFDYKTMEDRIRATAISATIAPLMGLGMQSAFGVASKIGRTVSKYKTSMSSTVKETSVGTLRDPRVPAIKQIRDSMQEANRQGTELGASASRQIQETNRTGNQVARGVSERADEIKSSISESVKAEQSRIKQSLNSSKRQIDRSIDITDAQLSKESDIAAKTYQSKITGFFRQNSAIYGKELDTISDVIAENGRMTTGEALSVLERTLERSGSEAEVLEGPIIEAIKKLRAKYAEEVTVQSGGSVVSRDMNELVSFKDFLGEVRSIWKNIKPYKSGARFSQDEIPAAILQSEFGELVSSLPGGEMFKDLQSAYRPVISYMNKATSVLQPYKGEAYTKTAELLVKRYAKGDAAEADKQLIQFMENGTERFAKGLGSVSGRARQLGENMKALSRSMDNMGVESERRIMKIAEEGAMKISKVNLAEKGALELIQKETMDRSSLILQEAAEEEGRLWARSRQLEGRKMTVENLTSRMQKIKSLANGTIKLIAGLSSGYLVLRGGSEIMRTIGEEK